MKRRFYVSVLDTDERKVILTGDMLPIDIVVENNKHVTFDVESNKEIEKDQILYEERPEEIYLTIMKNGNTIKGLTKVTIDRNHDFIVSYGSYNCKYDSKKKTLRILCWKNEKMIDQTFHGSIRRIHIGNFVKVSFFNGGTVKFDINS